MSLQSVPLIRLPPLASALILNTHTHMRRHRDTHLGKQDLTSSFNRYLSSFSLALCSLLFFSLLSLLAFLILFLSPPPTYNLFFLSASLLASYFLVAPPLCSYILIYPSCLYFLALDMSPCSLLSCVSPGSHLWDAACLCPCYNIPDSKTNELVGWKQGRALCGAACKAAILKV